METIKILVTLDENYLLPLRVMLTSLVVNNPSEEIEVWLLHRSIRSYEISSLQKYCQNMHITLYDMQANDSLLEKAPVSNRYPQEMYYRLLAPHLLPDTLNRILYLDPDTLVINPVRQLWDMNMREYLYAAAPHTGKTEFANNVNRIRLNTKHNYFNSGVLLIDLAKAREEIIPRSIFQYAEEHKKELLLPDQDILNSLYGSRTLELEDAVWNYDARNYNNYLLRSTGRATLDWVMQNTVIMHFCGRSKPWNPSYHYRFGMLYKHYMQVTARHFSSL